MPKVHKKPIGYIEAPKVFITGTTKEHKCPHCGYINNASNPIGGCANCRSSWVEYRGRYYYAPRVSA